MWETEQFGGTIDFHSIFFSTMEVNDASKQYDGVLVPHKKKKKTKITRLKS